MADVNMPDSKPCEFDKAWQGKCRKPSTNGWCSEHEDLKCVSCGERAVKECDHTGSFVCGANLCASCQHSRSGHVTKAVAEAEWKKEDEERKATEASRTSSVQRMDEELGVPLNRFELLKRMPAGFEIKEYYYLQLDHSLWGFFPAIFVDSKRVVITTDVELAKEVWGTMTPRKSKLSHNLGHVNEELGVVYPILSDDQYSKEDSKPCQLLGRAEFEELLVANHHPFRWAPGLLGDDMNADEFRELISTVAKQHDVQVPA